MQKKIGLGILLAVPFFVVVVPSSAQYSSPNYKIEETFMGTGGEVDSTSANYRSRQAAGSLGVGNTSSANYDLVAGYVTPSEPFLEVYVTGASVDFGELSETTTSTGEAKAGACNCSFTVRTYLSSAYVVVTASQPPTSEGGAVLDAKATLGIPSTDQDVEEFGINLVDNSSPNIGANPLNVPDNSFADGRAADGYNTANQFKYGVGDIVARSAATAGNQAVGNTDYTVSYIAKKKKLTEAGVFTMRHDLVVVATY